MSGEIWVSVWFYASLQSRKMAALESDLSLTDRKKSGDISKRNSRGEALPRDAFPTAFYGIYRDAKVGKLLDFFVGKGYFLVSEKAADVLRQFDLGNGSLYPVDIFEYDRTTPVGGQYFLLNIGCIKDALLPDQCGGIERPWQGHDIWWPNAMLKDDEVALARQAMEGPDLWCDGRFQNAFFLSGDLVAALRDTGTSEVFDLRRCRLL